jgi:hypothetical protein
VTPYSQILVDIAAFNVKGNYMGDSSNGVNNVAPIVSPTNGSPKFVVTLTQNIGVDSRDMAAGLLGRVLVSVISTSCAGSTIDACNAKPTLTRTFMRDAEVR